ncbi:sulfoxide reductase catalytic subunit YedY precursor [Acidithrix ferrooxidans]|uniref:Sulfoxide reductase catalytic subunit YedY n=2 Tax=Acidimicrobiaceae TaxID=84994 RepID=A0A0D8HCJ2_9ACTN|nr:sulfoxide reductase catalytic subunit YedY precursor [Acidithrix ferrooxidans]CAG4929742.1 unnamed protein product [Acidithrix sp. C25]
MDMKTKTPSSNGASVPRRVFVGLSVGGVGLVVAGSGLKNLLGGSALAGIAGISGYQIYTVTNGFPTTNNSSFRLEVRGQVANNLTLSLENLAIMHTPDLVATFHCVTGWSVPNQRFGGVTLSKVIEMAQPASSAKYVNFRSFDGVYTESLPLNQAMSNGTMLVTHLDGVPLPLEHGGPLRLFVNKSYGYKSIKWLKDVELSNSPITGYWENYGYPADARIPQS